MKAVRFDRYLPVAAQGSLIASGLVVAFGFPLLFGLHAFGLFVQATALTFVAHRIVDLITESVLVGRDFALLVRIALATALLAVLFSLPFALSLNLPEQLRLHYPLFAALVASTIALNGVFQARDPLLQFLYAAAFGALTTLGTLAFWLFSYSDLAMLLAGVNAVGALVGLLLIRSRGRSRTAPSDAGIPTTAGSFLPRLGLISFNVLLTYGVAVVEAHRFPPEALANLRLFSSIALLGATLTPVNVKSYYGMLDQVPTRKALVAKLSPHRAVLVGAGALWIVGMVAAAIYVDQRNAIFYLAGGALYPAAAYLSLQDKMILRNHGPGPMGAVVALFTTATLAITHVQSEPVTFVLTLAAMVAIYPVITGLALARDFLPLSIPAAGLSLVALGLVALLWLERS